MRRTRWLVLMAAIFPVALQAQQLFNSPDDAVKAFRAAAEAHDQAALENIFGPQVKELLTGDEVQDAKNARNLAKVMAEHYKLVNDREDLITIEVGPESWPLPIPLVKANGQWHFDTAAGKEEIINRHIGKDELRAIGVCRAYATGHRPLGSLLKVQPFHGYYFRTAGDALVAYPAHWDHSGIMTFIVKPDGKVYQRNFARKTSRIAKALKEFNPDSTWVVVQEDGAVNALSDK